MNKAECYKKLISLGIPRELLDAALAKGIDSERLLQKLKIALTPPAPFFKIEHQWQLEILGGDLSHVQSLLPTQWVEQDLDGTTPVQYIFWSGNLEAIKWVKENKPEALINNFKNRMQVSLAHFAAYSGNCAAIEWVQQEYPESIYELDKVNNYIAQYAALSGSPAMLEWINQNHPFMLDTENKYGENIAHMSAWSGNLEAILWVKQNRKHLLMRKNKINSTIAHYSSFFGDINLFIFLRNEFPNLLSFNNNNGENIAHFAAWSGNLEVLEWIKINKPELLKTLTRLEENVAHFAAKSGNPQTLAFIKRINPGSLYAKFRKVFNILYNAAKSPTDEMLIYLFECAPIVARNLLLGMSITDNTGLKISNVLNSILIKVTNRIINHEANSNDLEFLDLFAKYWEKLLASGIGFNIPNLLTQMYKFRLPKLQKIIHSLSPNLQILAFSFSDNITKEDLVALLQLTNTLSSKTILITTLEKFVTNCKESILSKNEILCLNSLVKDYQRGFLGSRTPIMNELINKLLNTMTLSQLRAKPKTEPELDISPENYQIYLDNFIIKVASIPLNEDERRIMNRTILPGLQVLISSQDEIVAHATSKFGSLYYLAENLPLHTDHTLRPNADEYRNTLRHLIREFFAAAHVAENAGKLQEFCGRVTIGFCFEGRVGNVFVWAISLCGLDTFQNLMAKATDEYLAYSAVMLQKTEVEASYLELASDFILKRYANYPCQQDPEYGDCMSKKSVETFIKNTLGYPSNSIILKLNQLIDSLKKERSFFWNQNPEKQALKQTKINALSKLVNSIENGENLLQAIAQIEDATPEVLHGSFSRTRVLLQNIVSEQQKRLGEMAVSRLP